MKYEIERKRQFPSPKMEITFVGERLVSGFDENAGRICSMRSIFRALQARSCQELSGREKIILGMLEICERLQSESVSESE